MTTKQMQCLLTYLGYDPGTIDGIDGRKTQAALAAFRADYGVGADGLVGAVAGTIAKLDKPLPADTTTGTFWDEVEFFTRYEFRCPCKRCGGFPVEPEETMVFVVNEIRRRAGVPISIVDSGGSGIRCKEHNAEVGGVANSEHLYGRAADLHSSLPPSRLKQIAEQVTAEMIPGKGGIGLYSWGIHVDTGKYSRWNG